ncbi:T9SS type A sorting domain-containing protein [Hymenobacter terrenus]|uniref:T9SS type A sorting domain-containing protein n=1 Tax=Hymenobacter terrenus TaxID=1629124 RepID=UPI00373FD63E
MVYLDNAIQRGQYGPLIRARPPAPGSQRLAFDLQALRPFFRTVLDSLPRYAVLHPVVAPPGKQPNHPRPVPQTPLFAERTRLYPNPATDQVTLAVATSGGWKAQLFTLGGHLLQTRQTRDSVLVLSLAGLSPGDYLVQLTENGTRHTAKKRLQVQQ